MYIYIGEKVTDEGCMGYVGDKAESDARDTRRPRDARDSRAFGELSNGILAGETNIDLNGVTIREAPHVPFGEQPVGEEGEKDKLGESQQLVPGEDEPCTPDRQVSDYVRKGIINTSSLP